MTIWFIDPNTAPTKGLTTVGLGLRDFAKTDFTNTTLNGFLPKDDGVCAATGYWERLNEFRVHGRLIPNTTVFHLTFTFENGKLIFTQNVVRGRKIGERQGHADFKHYHS